MYLNYKNKLQTTSFNLNGTQKHSINVHLLKFLVRLDVNKTYKNYYNLLVYIDFKCLTLKMLF